ncbi:MAG TPA: hypothetical protein VFM25_12440 [Verrucomicrobiae bacterium]|nr:hypothetical protein [Verrucomicrobiae bacterium]
MSINRQMCWIGVCGLLAIAGLFSSADLSLAQPEYSAWDFPVAEGNDQVDNGLGIGNDFEVIKPITILSLGVFDDNGDGIRGGAILKVCLYASNPDRARKRASGTLLEAVSFDATDSGKLVGGFRYKKLLHPVTLLPGSYTLTVEGFDEQNLDWKKPEGARGFTQIKTRVSLNDGGCISFGGCSFYHIGYFLKRTRTAKNAAAPERAADRFAAATIRFSPAANYQSPFASDYAALITGVRSFPWDTNKSSYWSYRYGSISVLDANAFPVIVEPSGKRLIFEAGGIYEGNPQGARCVLFADDQWENAKTGNRAALFDNAIKWASRKRDPSRIVIGISRNLNADLLRSRGYKVFGVDGEMNVTDKAFSSGCDVLVLDLQGEYEDEFFERVAEFLASGGALIATISSSNGRQEEFASVLHPFNTLLKPFGLAFRSTLSQLNDLDITNLQSVVYPPILFNAFPAAQLLYENRRGQVQLSSLEKTLALHTISYAIDGQADLLTAMTAVYLGSPSSVGELKAGGVGSFDDVISLTGVQASASRIGEWDPDGTDVVATNRGGAVDYHFNLTDAGVYRIQLFGSEVSPPNFPDIFVSIDGIPLGQYCFQLPQGNGTLLALFSAKLGTSQTSFSASDRIECLTPSLPVGPHTFRVIWNNPSSSAQFRIKRINIQAASGEDSDGDGVKDWVPGLIDSQSGLDLTNAMLASYTSPVCIEGRDPFPSLMKIHVAGADAGSPMLTATPAPNDRWYVNVPLSKNNDVTMQVSFQNGAKIETQQIRWLPVNVLDGGSYIIRDGDSLLLGAWIEGSASGTAQLTIGTNHYTVSASSSISHVFSSQRIATKTGTYGSRTVTVNGTYVSPSGITQSGSITVNVVRHEFKNNPACWIGHERDWELHLPEEVSFEPDQRLFVESREQLADGGLRVGLVASENQPRYFLSRLGKDGPVLSSGVVNGFDFWWSKDTYLKILETYPDGSQLIEMLLMMNPVVPTVTVQLDVLVGGVVFEDGTTTKQLTRANFDAQGKCRLRFIRPPAFKPSVCHSIKILQGGSIIGQVW